MHPIRSLLFMAIGIALAVAVALGFALERAGLRHTDCVVVAILAFLAIAAPAVAGFTWSVRRIAEIDRLADLTQRVAAGRYGGPLSNGRMSVEAGDLARAIDEVRAIILRQQESFEQQQAMLRHVLASMSEGLVALSANGRVIFANRRMTEMFDFRDSIVGRPLVEVLCDDAIIKTVEAALGGERGVARFRVPLRTIEARVVPVHAVGDVAAVALFIELLDSEIASLSF